MKKLLIVSAVVLLSGCATKQYPLLASVSDEEAKLFSCREIQLEIVKAESTRKEIDKIGEFSGATVTGFLGDFGIGNGIAKSEAESKVEVRLQQLNDLYQKKNCKEWEAAVNELEAIKPMQ